MNRDVIIVGGGIAGMFLGALLGRRGFDVAVTDDREEFDHQVGEHIQQITLKAISRVWPGAVDNPYMVPWREACIENFRLGYSLRQKFSGVVWEQNYLMNRKRFDGELARAASEHCEIQLRTKVVELLRDGPRICGVRASRADGSSVEMTAPLTIIAGGAKSRPLLKDLVSYEPLPLEEEKPRQCRRAILEVVPGRPGSLELGTLYLTTDQIEGSDVVMIAARQDPQTSLFYAVIRRRRGIPPMKLGGDFPELAHRLFHGSFAERAINDLQLGKIVDDQIAARFSVRVTSELPPGLLLIGTAAGYSEPLPGHGITLSIADAIHIASLLSAAKFPEQLPSPELIQRFMREKAKIVEADLAHSDDEWDMMTVRSKYFAMLGAGPLGKVFGWLPPLRQWVLGPRELLQLDRLWGNGPFAWLRRPAKEDEAKRST